MKLQHLKNKAIDYQLWDEKIAVSQGGLPYAQSWFLDIVSPGWEALVSDNYDYIMPLPLKKKFALPYLIQPAFTQQIGIFSAKYITEDIVKLFIDKIPYLSFAIHLNENNLVEDSTVLPNYVLQLASVYSEIAGNYSKNTKRNLEKAQVANLQFNKSGFDDEIRQFMVENANKSYSTKLDLIFEIISTAEKHSKIEIFTVRNTQNEIHASACFHKSNGRMVYVFPVSAPEAKQNAAMFRLIDNVIQMHANTETLLDFEGSQVESIARFYKGFGAINKPYYLIKRFRP